MFVKLTKEEQTIDCIENPLFVKWQKRNALFLVCDEADGEGIVSSDGEKIYHLAGVKSSGRFPYGDVAYEEISEEEYATLKAELEENNETFTIAEFIAEVNAE